MDHSYARNYWRKAFLASSDGKVSAKDFDEWFPGEPGHSDFQDRVLEAFDQMLRACEKGTFSRG